MAHPRERVDGERVEGTVISWRGSFGWIKPEEPVEHDKAEMHGGRLFLHKKDLEEGTTRLRRRQKVDFIVYFDESGLGAEEVRVIGEPPDDDEGSEGEKGEKKKKGFKRVHSKDSGPRSLAAVRGARKWLGKGRGGRIARFEPNVPAPWVRVAESQPFGLNRKGSKGGIPRGKGKGKVPTPPKGPPKKLKRTQLGTIRHFGKVVVWRGKFGFILPDEPIEHEGAEEKHNGKVYFGIEDLDSPDEHPAKGAEVDFIAYADTDGIGAEKVRVLSGGKEPENGGKGTKGSSRKGSDSGKGGVRALPKKGGSVGKGPGKGKNGVQKTIDKAKPTARPEQPKKGKRKGEAASELPGAWEEHWSEEHGIVYFWNADTKESRWTRPTK